MATTKIEVCWLFKGFFKGSGHELTHPMGRTPQVYFLLWTDSCKFNTGQQCQWQSIFFLQAEPAFDTAIITRSSRGPQATKSILKDSRVYIQHPGNYVGQLSCWDNKRIYREPDKLTGDDMHPPTAMPRSGSCFKEFKNLCANWRNLNAAWIPQWLQKCTYSVSRCDIFLLWIQWKEESFSFREKTLKHFWIK